MSDDWSWFGDDGVSPVIAVILLVAVTVALSAVVGSLTVNMADSVDNVNTGSAAQVTEVAGGVTVTAHTLGNADALIVKKNGSTVANLTSVGQSVTVSANGSETITVLSLAGGSRTVVQSHTVSASVSAGSGGTLVYSTSADWNASNTTNVKISSDTFTRGSATMYADTFEDGDLTEYKETGSYGGATVVSESAPDGGSHSGYIHQNNGGGTTYAMYTTDSVNWGKNYKFAYQIKSDNYTASQDFLGTQVRWRTSPGGDESHRLDNLMFAQDSNSNLQPFQVNGNKTTVQKKTLIDWNASTWYNVRGYVDEQNNTVYAKVWEASKSEPSGWDAKSTFEPNGSTEPITFFVNGQSSVDLDLHVAHYKFTSTTGILTTEFKQFDTAKDASSLTIESKTSQSSNDTIVAYVESDVDGDGVVDETSDKVVLDGSGGPYSVSGLTQDTKSARVRIEVHAVGNSTPTVDAIELKGT